MVYFRYDAELGLSPSSFFLSPIDASAAVLYLKSGPKPGAVVHTTPAILALRLLRWKQKDHDVSSV